MNAKRLVHLLAGGALFCLLGPAFSAVFSVGPGSAFEISGGITINVSAQGVSSSGSGTFAEQGPGSLHSNLGGLINTDLSASNITFLSGNTFSALPSGNWQPSGLPASFGFELDLAMSGPLSGTTFKLIGDLRDLSFMFAGSRGLVGSPGNQSFDTAGLQLTTLSGTIDMQMLACSGPTNCTDLGKQSFTPEDNGESDTLPAGTGTLANVGNVLTLTIPVTIDSPVSESQTVDVEGISVNVAMTGNFALNGNVVATLVPEPSTWAMLGIGIVAMGLGWRRGTRTAAPS